MSTVEASNPPIGRGIGIISIVRTAINAPRIPVSVIKIVRWDDKDKPICVSLTDSIVIKK